MQFLDWAMHQKLRSTRQSALALLRELLDAKVVALVRESAALEDSLQCWLVFPIEPAATFSSLTAFLEFYFGRDEQMR
ncbi:MAG: hypothetical protein OK454_03830, partial [Thaumarchaeota archaeon]|nr:hypothetical protein [Nitrososphaerota archaeon]